MRPRASSKDVGKTPKTSTGAAERRRSAQARLAEGKALRALARRLLAVREEEGRRIARDVHDVLGQALTALKLDLTWLARRVTLGGETTTPEVLVVWTLEHVSSLIGFIHANDERGLPCGGGLPGEVGVYFGGAGRAQCRVSPSGIRVPRTPCGRAPQVT